MRLLTMGHHQNIEMLSNLYSLIKLSKYFYPCTLHSSLRYLWDHLFWGLHVSFSVWLISPNIIEFVGSVSGLPYWAWIGLTCSVQRLGMNKYMGNVHLSLLEIEPFHAFKFNLKECNLVPRSLHCWLHIIKQSSHNCIC